VNTRVVYATSHDGVRVAASVRGSGFPLVHLGLPALSHSAIEPNFEHTRAWMERLARRHTLIAIDLRGTGLADRHCAEHSFDDYVEDIVAVLDSLRVPAADINAAGVRSGVAIRFAARQPHRVRRLVLQAVTVAPTAAGGRPLVEPAAREFVAANFRAYLETVASRLASSEVSVQPAVDRMLKCTDQTSMLAAMDALNREDIRDDVARIRCPTLVVELRDNTLIAPGHADAFRALVPHAEIAYIPNTPMFAWMADHAAALEEFEDRLDAAEGRALSHPELSAREAGVLALLATGCSNAEIAAELTLSVRTVERHITNIYTKLGVRNRAEATRWALTHGISPDSHDSRS